MTDKVKGIILRPGKRHSKLLIIKTERNSAWELPGGKQEPRDSDLLETYKRELREEINTEPVNIVYYGSEHYRNGGGELAHAAGYLSEITNEPYLSPFPAPGSSRVIAYEWVTRKQLKKYKQSTSLKRFSARLIKDGLL